MDTSAILAELRQERQRLKEAILSLERLAPGGAKRRGRPPAWMAAVKTPMAQASRRGRPVGGNHGNEADMPSPPEIE